ncbi:hypothetical protein [Pseudomonas asiatica]|uniref:Morphogenetic protein n=1 Tax=Pseudomonas asiatica TaxID=2219225 RepID=A0A9X4D562_9PSED|nr:hypothetical protein [Pseudomonas asiatica]MDD2110103.1 hypothetical protein [Pseudomonas asiatica]
MSQAKERPILFSGPMVRALLDGRKTVTRRPIKPSMRGFDVSFELHQQDDGSWRPMHTFDESCMDDQGTEHPVVCPYGKPGDRLWVRETWYCDHFEVMRGPYLKPADLDITEARDDGTLVYAADGLAPYEADQPVWKPSIHMPRWASRILLEVTDVRVERLQDISEQQALAEGVRLYTDHAELGDWYHVEGIDTYSADPRKSFELLWTGINGAESWDVNPWVWAVKFKRIEQ